MPSLRVPPDLFFLNREDGRSLQSQIRETVVRAILSQHATPGARLPSTRKLASHLGVARMTITLAFQELVAQGFLEAASRSAYVVSDRAPDIALKTIDPKQQPKSTVDWSKFVRASLRSPHMSRKPVDWRKFRYPFIYGQSDSRLFNHAAWRACSTQAIEKRDFEGLAGDAMAIDDPILINYIRERILPRRGISADPKEILVTMGAQHALWLSIELLTRGPLNAVVENPGYPDTVSALKWCGAKVLPVDIDDQGLPTRRLSSLIDAVFVTPCHHAPTGVAMSMNRREDLLHAAEANDFIVVEDDYDFQMSYLAPPSPALKALDRNGRVIYAGSISKVLFPGLRLGYLVGPELFIEEARHVRAIMMRHTPGHLQRTTAYFMTEGYFDSLIQEMRHVLKERRAVLEEAIRSSSLKIAGAAAFGGSSLWIKGPDGLDADVLEEKLAQKSVLIESGSAFFHDANGPREFFRLGYASIPKELIPDGVRLIDATLAGC